MRPSCTQSSLALHSVAIFLYDLQRVAVGESNQENLKALIEGATSLFQRLQKGTTKVHAQPMPINGDVALPCRADDLKVAEKVILKSYLNIARSIVPKAM